MNERWKTSIDDWLGRMTFWRGVAIAILALGLYTAVVRFSQGLGAATHLSDAFPWGMWIGFDVLVGVGLAAGGFVIAAAVHVFHLERYESIARPTVLTAFLGYLMVIVALMFDLGRPWNIWHPLVMWNTHSVMFEVGWCVMLYTTVLALEFSPLVFERFGWKRPLRLIRTAYVPLVIAGVLLSTMHQSSLGTLYVIAPDKLYGLWYSPLLPVFFFISAIGGGLAMTIFESFMSSRAFGKRLESDLLQGLGRVCVVVLGFYLVWRFEDLALRDSLHLAFQVTPESVLFWGEIGLGAVLPMLLFAYPPVRRSEHGLFLAAMLTILGFVCNRMNVAVTGMAASSGVNYLPSWMEFAVTAAVVALGFILFSLAVKHLPVFPESHEPQLVRTAEGLAPEGVAPALGRGVLVSLWLLFFIGVLAVGFSSTRRAEAEPAAGLPTAPVTAEVARAADLRLPAPYPFPAGEDSPGTVTFNHESHVDSRTPDCAGCHATRFSLNARGAVLSGEIDYERIHEGDLCAGCHNGQDAFTIEDGCDVCHAM